MTNGEFKIRRQKGKWRRKQVVCRDCNMQPVRVGDIVRLRYDKFVGFGEWDEDYIECEVCGRPKGGLPVLAKIKNGNIVEREFDPEEDLEKIDPEVLFYLQKLFILGGMGNEDDRISKIIAAYTVG